MLGLITESFGISSSTMAFMRFGLVDKKIAFRSLTGAVRISIRQLQKISRLQTGMEKFTIIVYARTE